MAIIAEVIARNYYTRINGETREAPIGHKLTLRNIPKDMSHKLKMVREIDESELVVNDSPEAAKLRDEGKPQAADKLMSEEKETKAAKRSRTAKPKAEPAEPKAEPGLPKPDAK